MNKILVVAFLFGSSSFCFGQTVFRPSANGLLSNVPVIPEKDARPMTDIGGMNVQQQSSVGSFIESIKGNDAAIEVVLGQGRLLTLREKLANNDASGVVAVGDPSMVDFQILPNLRSLRVMGLRPGVTDLSVTTVDDETVSFEIHVTYDMSMLDAKLRQLFPDAHLKLGQLREHLVVEGQARDPLQAARILEVLEAYIASMQAEVEQQGQSNDDPRLLTESEERAAAAANAEASASDADLSDKADLGPAVAEFGGLESARATIAQGSVINLIRIPGAQQVLLKVRIAELNRTAIREIGADILGVDSSNGNMIGTRIGGAGVSAASAAGLGGILASASQELGTSSTTFGIFPSSDFNIIFRALRRNGFLRVLAEPNLIAMSGHRANFLAGGEFPVPVPQSTGGVANSVTVDFREFGVRLDFLPYIVKDDRIRLSVTPEVSTIDFTLGTTLVAGGSPVPGLNTRRANTTVELTQGQTLAIAGLLQVELDGLTNRIPGLGDLPYIGPFFSNTTHRRVEKELVVLVTPYLVDGLEEHELGPLPGDDIQDPTDRELYLGNRYEGWKGENHRSTVDYGRNPRRLMYYEQKMISGPVGYSN